MDIKPAGIGADWNRGLRATVRTPQGEVAVYVAHLPSVRIRPRAASLRPGGTRAPRAGRGHRRGEAGHGVLLGDLNGTVDDRGLAPLTSRMTAARAGLRLQLARRVPDGPDRPGHGPRGDPRHIRTLPATGSDHLPVVARVEL